MLNIVIPMAGAGSRFAKVGYTLPKPLIPVKGVPMIQLVVNNLKPEQEHRFIFLCQKSHINAYDLTEKLSKFAPGSVIVPVEGLTEGAACTVLLAKALIDNDAPMMIANSDQYVDIDVNTYLDQMGAADGLIMTMPGTDPKWSYVSKDSAGYVTQAVEKQVISDEATVGIYNFARGRDFVKAAESMIDKNLRASGEFYVAPAYNEMIAQGARVVTHDVGASMHGIGIPTDLEAFLETSVCSRAVEGLL